MIEIERKYLVKDNSFKTAAHSKMRIVQGFLNTDPERTVRIRIQGPLAYLTIKGKTGESGLSRFEWEKEIEVREAEALLELCEPGAISKTRYLIKVGSHTYEIDEFEDDNQGLIIAEIELNSEDEAFEKPNWLGREVSGQIQYYNSQLCKNPYKNWNINEADVDNN